MNTVIKSKRITAHLFEYGGRRISFTPVPLGENATVQKFAFAVVGDPDLTEKLINASKKLKVEEKDFFFAANGLFEKIESSRFEKPLDSQNGIQMKELTEHFQKEFKQSPKFAVEDKSVKGFHLFEAILLNFDSNGYIGTGTNKQEAKLNVLKSLYEI